MRPPCTPPRHGAAGGGHVPLAYCRSVPVAYSARWRGRHARHGHAQRGTSCPSSPACTRWGRPPWGRSTTTNGTRPRDTPILTIQARRANGAPVGSPNPPPRMTQSTRAVLVFLPCIVASALRPHLPPAVRPRPASSRVLPAVGIAGASGWSVMVVRMMVGGPMHRHDGARMGFRSCASVRSLPTDNRALTGRALAGGTGRPGTARRAVMPLRTAWRWAITCVVLGAVAKTPVHPRRPCATRLVARRSRGRAGNGW